MRRGGAPGPGPAAPARVALGGALCAASLAASAALDLQLAHEQSAGRYGAAEATVIRSTTATLRWRGDAAMVSLELPWLDVRTDAPRGGLPDAGGRGAQAERGQGDAWWRVELPLQEFAPERLGIDLLIKLKTASGSYPRGLGSGARDVALQFDLTRSFGPVVAFAEIGWRCTGEPSGGVRLHDPWYGELGGYFVPAPGWEAGAHVDVRQRIGSLGSLRELTIYGAWRQGAQRLQWHVTTGNTRASVQQAVGLSWRWRWH